MPRKVPLLKVDSFYDQYHYDDIELLLDGKVPYFEGEFTYELTVTFNQRIHNRATALAAHSKIVQLLLSWLVEQQVKELLVATEYQKNGMAHYHMELLTEYEVDEEQRSDIVSAFQRRYGFNSFKPVIDHGAYHEYILKDCVANTKAKGYSHLSHYSRK